MACVSNAEHSWTRAFAIACVVGVPVIYVLAPVAQVFIDGGIDAGFTRSQRPDFDEAKAVEPVFSPMPSLPTVRCYTGSPEARRRMNWICAPGEDMAIKSFEFLFDFAGPNGYLVHRVLPRFCAETGVTATYVPVLLGGLMKATNNRPPWAVYADVPAKLAYDRLEFNRFIAKNGLNRFRMNPHFPSNSLKLMRACVAAARIGVMAEFVEAMMTAVWEERLDMGDADAVRTRLDAAGLDGALLLALADDPDVKTELVANTESAVARGAFGIPTFFVSEEMFFGKERLAQVAAALAY